jgi:CHAD domain-containing protein
VVLAHLREHVARLQAQDPLVRADQHDAVHQQRVASRRLRSALASYRPLFDRVVTDLLRDELAWLATVLGAARDAEVVRDHLRAAVEAEPADLVVGEVVARIVATLDARYRAAHDELLLDLDRPRYFALLDRLDALVGAPPFAAGPAGQPRPADRPADEVLLVARAFGQVRTLVRAADAAGGQEERDLLLHDVRKAAKRARYAGESLVPGYGKPAARFAQRMAAVQEVLGEHQDSVVVRDELRRLAAEAFAAGESTFTYGRLHALEQARGERTQEAFQATWDDAAQARWRAWLR